MSSSRELVAAPKEKTAENNVELQCLTASWLARLA